MHIYLPSNLISHLSRTQSNKNYPRALSKRKEFLRITHMPPAQLTFFVAFSLAGIDSDDDHHYESLNMACNPEDDDFDSFDSDSDSDFSSQKVNTPFVLTNGSPSTR